LFSKNFIGHDKRLTLEFGTLKGLDLRLFLWTRSKILALNFVTILGVVFIYRIGNEERLWICDFIRIKAKFANYKNNHYYQRWFWKRYESRRSLPTTLLVTINDFGFGIWYDERLRFTTV
jgi:hypothetical protein